MDEHQHADLSIDISPENFQAPSGYKPGSHHAKHKKSFTSTRTALHHGRKIKVKTTYRIEIDGEPLTLHTSVTNDGKVHYHGLPNYAFASALEMAKAIVDAARHVPIVEDELSAHDPHDHSGSSSQSGAGHDAHKHGGTN